MKRYKSFDEINRDLKYLRLKTKIDMEEIKLGITSTKDMLAETFSPKNLLIGTISTVAKKRFYTRAIDRYVKFKPVRNLLKRLF